MVSQGSAFPEAQLGLSCLLLAACPLGFGVHVVRNDHLTFFPLWELLPMELGITRKNFFFTAFLLPGEMTPYRGWCSGHVPTSSWSQHEIPSAWLWQPPPGRRDIPWHTFCTPVSGFTIRWNVESAVTQLFWWRLDWTAECLLFMCGKMELWLYCGWLIFS